MNQKTALLATTSIIVISSIVGYGIFASEQTSAAQVKEFKNKSVFDSESFQSYVSQKSITLKQLNEKQPDRIIQAGVSFKRVLTQSEIDTIKTQHSLTVEYFEYVTSNNVVGGASTKIFPDLNRVSDYLKESHNVDAIGITYVLVAGKASEMQKVNTDENTILVDIGTINEIDQANADGNIGVQNMPPNLHTWYNKLGK